MAGYNRSEPRNQTGMRLRLQNSREQHSHATYVGLITAFAFALYIQIFTYNTFGPETPLFYFYSDGQPFGQMLRSYTYVSLMWYRPTAFAVPYWLLEQFLGWHNLVAWKLAHFSTVLASAYAIYWLVVRPLGGSRMAGLLSAMYFIAQPSMYSAVMEAAGFDFLHILLVVLCVGFYILGTRTKARRCFLFTSISWLLFLIALTTKEMALATPGCLVMVSALTAWLEPDGNSRWPGIRREAVRLAPFFALLPVYYVIHLTKIPIDALQVNDPYRSTANWTVILANLRKFPLWIVRIYAWTGETLQGRMYQSTVLNNLAGLSALVLVVVQCRWIQRSSVHRFALFLMLAWTAVYLVLPVYSGGFLWHINLAVVGYSVLFGFAFSGLFASIKWAALGRAVFAAFLLGWLLLGRENLRTELDAGSHATGYRINHSVLQHPPIPAAALGKEPLIYIEDRLGLGPWWYGCFGRLFNFAYLRHDIEEVIVPLVSSVPREARKKWLAHENAFFFRYDEDYNWHDASAEFRVAALQHGPLELNEACNTSLSPGTWPIRIAAGRNRQIDRLGMVWEPDASYDGGKTYFTDKPVAGTTTPELYQSERFDQGPFEYRICVPNGPYTVKLKFAEIWFDSPGKRIFDVALNGTRVLKHFDIVAAAKGPDRALDCEFRTRVVDGRIVIQFLPILSNPKINAIEITPGG